MTQVWVDPAGLGGVARTVADLGETMTTAAPGVEDVDAALPGSLAAEACTAGGRASARVVALVAERLRWWSTTAQASADGYAQTDEATARLLDGVAATLPTAGVGR